MLKRRSKHFALLLVLTMLATMFVGVGTASAASSIACDNPLQVGTDGDRNLGTVRVNIDMTAINNGDTLTLRLPADYQFYPKNGTSNTILANTTWRDVTTGATPRIKTVSELQLTAADGVNYAINTPIIRIEYPAFDNAFCQAAGANPISVTAVSDNEIKLTYASAGVDTNFKTGYFDLKFLTTYVPAGAETEVKLFGEKQSASGFPVFSTLTIATTTAGESTATIDSVKSLTGNGTLDVIRIKENRAAAMDACNTGAATATSQTITVKLPTGMEWDPTTTITGDWGLGAYTMTTSAAGGAWVAGFANAAAASNTVKYGCDSADKQKLLISVSDSTATAGILKITPKIIINEADAKVGDITVTFGGKETVSTGTLVIGKYVDFGVVAEAGTVKTVKAGSDDAETGYFFVKENGPGSLLNGRTVTLTLSGSAKWDNANPTVVSYEKGNATLGAWSAVGTDNRTIKAIVTGGTSTTTIKFKTPKVRIAPDAVAGDLNVEVGGTAGAKGTVKIADIVPRVTGSVSAASDLRIGVQSQLLGDILIKEGAKEGLRKANFLVKLPTGMTFAEVPKVEVAEGDIGLDTAAIKLTNNDDSVLVAVKSTSGVASTIKLSGVKVNVNRVVPEGPFNIELATDDSTTTPRVACALFTANSVAANYWANTTKAVTITGGNIVTPAPGEVNNKSAFVIGSTTFKLNGVDKTMDVAPYIKDSRTYMPIRYVANAMGIADANILWDGANQTVTLMKGDKVVQLKIGSKVILINGASVSMDVAPEIANGRTMLPVSFVANAFGATAAWDAATQTVSIE